MSSFTIASYCTGAYLWFNKMPIKMQKDNSTLVVTTDRMKCVVFLNKSKITGNYFLSLVQADTIKGTAMQISEQQAFELRDRHNILIDTI
jgi:hypothetical protein